MMISSENAGKVTEEGMFLPLFAESALDAILFSAIFTGAGC